MGANSRLSQSYDTTRASQPPPHEADWGGHLRQMAENCPLWAEKARRGAEDGLGTLAPPLVSSPGVRGGGTETSPGPASVALQEAWPWGWPFYAQSDHLQPQLSAQQHHRAADCRGLDNTGVPFFFPRGHPLFQPQCRPPPSTAREQMALQSPHKQAPLHTAKAGTPSGSCPGFR